MDGRGKNARGEDGAEQVNERELLKLSWRTGKPILAMRSYHGPHEKGMKPELLDDAEFRGLLALLNLCEGARVLLTHNEWVEAGLMNGALGRVRGFVWPEGGDPNSKDEEKQAPLCVVVEFDDVDLGEE